MLGLLDDYVTRSGYVMTPVVCWAGPVGELAGNPAEVAAIHQIPLADLDVEPRLISSIPESDAPVIQLPLLGGFLHRATTAAIVYQLCRIACRGTVARVADYEQPVFASALGRQPRCVSPCAPRCVSPCAPPRPVPRGFA